MNDASQANDGTQDGALQAQGPGRIVINGEPGAQGNCMVTLSGVRPGVDGQYWCQTAEHIYSRHQGYITWLDIFAVTINGQGQAVDSQGRVIYNYNAPYTLVTPED
jgi:phage protein D